MVRSLLRLGLAMSVLTCAAIAIGYDHAAAQLGVGRPPMEAIPPIMAPPVIQAMPPMVTPQAPSIAVSPPPVAAPAPAHHCHAECDHGCAAKFGSPSVCP